MSENKSVRVGILKNLLEEKKRKLQKDMLRDASEKLGREHKTDFVSGMDEADLAVIQNTQSLGLLLLDKGKNELIKLNKALGKLEDGTYGVCESCAEEINEMRLAAIVHAIHCVGCAAQNEKYKEGNMP